MASQSATPSNPTDDNSQNPASGVVQPPGEEQQNKAEATKENSRTSVFVNSEPMREEQVQNAVKFLSHPKVRGSPVIYRRSFLEKKGLTKDEIDEAFRRVPDPPSTVSTTQPAATMQDGQLKSSSNVQSHALTQTLQPAVPTPGAINSKAGMFSRFHWSHALLAVGLLTVSGAGTAVLLKNSIIPRLKSWIRKVVLDQGEEEDLVKITQSKPSLAEEAAAAAKAAAAAAADVARASQEMLISKTEEKRCFEELMNLLDVQVREMKSMSSAIRQLEGQSNIPGKISSAEQEDRRVAVTGSMHSYANGKPEADLLSVRSSLPPSSARPSIAPRPKSYMEPWDVGQTQISSSQIFQSQAGGDGLGFKLQDDGFINQLNGESSEPWWQRKNVRITEIEAADEQKTVSSGVLTNQRPVQRSWVPPQPPPVAMPEAAAAIRQPKKPLLQKAQLTDDQLLARSSDAADELPRITEISESGGVVEANGGNSELNTSEIQEENTFVE